jgi:LPXTG-motif cell wall-anchored protein
MNSFLRRTVPAALLAGGALMVATAGAAGAQVPVPGADGLPTGGADSLSGAPAALCTGPLGAISGLSGVCDVAGDDQVQVGEASQVLPTADATADESQAQEQPQSAVNVDLQGDEEPEPQPCNGGEPGDCDVPEEEPCDGCPPPEEPCEECPPHETTMPPTSETTVTTVTTTAPPTTHIAAAPPAEELPRTGSTVAPFVVAGAALLAVGTALVASKRYAIGRR